MGMCSTQPAPSTKNKYVMMTSHTTVAMNTRSALNLGEPVLHWKQAMDPCNIDHADKNKGQMENRSTCCPFPPLWNTHVLNTDVDPSTTWGFYQACKDLIIIHSNISNLSVCL